MSPIDACSAAMALLSVNSTRKTCRTISATSIQPPRARWLGQLRTGHQMSHIFPSVVNLSSLRALFAREFRAALINRYFQVFCALGLMGGIAAAIFGEDGNAIAVFHVQIAIYFVSLFALLAGVGSAQAEREEWQLLFAQPLPRAACVVGKFCALVSMFGGVLLLMFVPGLLAGLAIHALATLYFETFLLAATFLAAGLAAGYLAHDRAQGLIVG